MQKERDKIKYKRNSVTLSKSHRSKKKTLKKIMIISQKQKSIKINNQKVKMTIKIINYKWRRI